ncbi:MAG: hypothetical protein JXB14_08310 [Candidatus Altiarchaeota archaeon]|nr:hypothetical protein [Candidatus Altiarchaeota archaeon]
MMAKRPTDRKPAAKIVRRPKTSGPRELKIMEELTKLREQRDKLRGEFCRLSANMIEGEEGSTLARKMGAVSGEIDYWTMLLKRTHKPKT